MWNARLDESQSGIKTPGRNINNLRYADDTTLMAESEEELQSLLRVKEECEEAGLKLNIKKNKIQILVTILEKTNKSQRLRNVFKVTISNWQKN